MARSSTETKKKTKSRTAKRDNSGKGAAARPRKSAGSSTRPQAHPSDAIALLKADHRKMRQLLDGLKTANTPARRQHLLSQVEQELKAHTTIEEEIFYPAFRDAGQTNKDRRMYFEAVEEHHAADLILGEVGRAGDESEEFGGRAKVLTEMVEHHADEEEHEMFPRARTLLPPAERRRLGEEMAERKRDLLRGNGSTGRTGRTLSKVASLITSPFSG